MSKEYEEELFLHHSRSSFEDAFWKDSTFMLRINRIFIRTQSSTKLSLRMQTYQMHFSAGFLQILTILSQQHFLLKRKISSRAREEWFLFFLQNFWKGRRKTCFYLKNDIRSIATVLLLRSLFMGSRRDLLGCLGSSSVPLCARQLSRIEYQQRRHDSCNFSEKRANLCQVPSENLYLALVVVRCAQLTELWLHSTA